MENEEIPNTTSSDEDDVILIFMISLVSAIMVGLYMALTFNTNDTMTTETVVSDTGKETTSQISTDDYDAEVKIVENGGTGDIDVFITYTDIKNKDKNPKEIIAEILETLPDMYDGSSDNINIRIPQSSKE